MENMTFDEAAALLMAGGIGVLPTDTVYGVVARASDPDAVERVYKVRDRSPDKACIILVAGLHQITDTQDWTNSHHRLARKYWPGPLSLLAPITNDSPYYLHRGTGALVYRTPDIISLRGLLEKTGPLIAPSANPEGTPPATTLAQAKEYFGTGVDFYVDGGRASESPSTIAAIEDGNIVILRQGALHISPDE